MNDAAAEENGRQPGLAKDSHAATTGDDRGAPATLVAGRYRLLGVLGTGAMGTVSRSYDMRLSRSVALRMLPPVLLSQPNEASRFLREAEAAARLDHPNLVKCYDAGFDGDGYFLVTELGGRDLGRVLRQRAGVPLSVGVVLAIAHAVCRALDYLHRRGIMHGDLKPSSILMGNPDDPPDFAVDPVTTVKLLVSGVTQVRGLPVDAVPVPRGTPHFLSPERIAGREGDERADLYALGIILYELCTGIRPFTSPDSLSILNQHISLSPLPPSVFNRSISADLDSLILRLLEKKPDLRPASAQAVALALDQVRSRLSVADVSPVGPGAAGEDGLSHSTRRVFVGRTRELRELQSALLSALAGRGAIVLVSGEPGIGKTALCGQLADVARQRGVLVLQGACYEGGATAQPYLPFTEALRSYVRLLPVEALREALGAGAADLARIVPDISERLGVDIRRDADADNARWRLHEVVTDLLRNGGSQPLLLILDDLHWADRGTLDLLAHLARHLDGTKLLIAATHRNTPGDRSNALSEALTGLRRDAVAARVTLHGLSAEEVQRMAEAACGHAVHWNVVEVIHRQTEGIPLFVQEVLRSLLEEGLLAGDPAGQLAIRVDDIARHIPDGIREAIRVRLARLSQNGMRLLSIASVIGREFSLTTLRTVAELPEEALLEALEEGAHAGVLQEQEGLGSITYRFAHTLFQQSLYDELIAPRRLRLHQQIARALEAQYAGRLEEHAGVIAEHFVHSTDGSNLAKAVMYGEMAARGASAVYAYADAVRLWRRTLQLQEILDPADRERRCQLLLEMGHAMLLAGEARSVAENIASQALELAEATGNVEDAASACRLALDGLWRYGAGSTFGTPAYRRWAERAARYARAGTADRVATDLALARVSRSTGDYTRASELETLALDQARQLGDPEMLATAVADLLQTAWSPAEQHERLQLAEEFAAWQQDGVRLRTQGILLAACGWVFLEWGQRERAERLWQRVAAWADQSLDPDLVLSSLQAKGVLHALDGQFAAALEVADRLRNTGSALGMPFLGRQYAAAVSLRPLLYQGRADEALALLPDASQWPGVDELSVLPALAILCLEQAGRTEEAKAALDQLLTDVDLEVADDQMPASFLALLLETAVLVGHRKVAGLIADRLTGLAQMLVPRFALISIGQLLGRSAALAGNAEAALQWYEHSLQVASAARFQPEVALSRLLVAQLGHHASSPGVISQDVAGEHLSFAVAQFRTMLMYPALEVAQRLEAEILEERQHRR